MQTLDQVLAAKALPGWYWIMGRGLYERAEPMRNGKVDVMVATAYVLQDAWHGGWVASKDNPASRSQRWRAPEYLFEGMRFDDPTAAMAAVEVELASK